MAAIINIGLDNLGHLSQKTACSIALDIIGRVHIKDWCVYGAGLNPDKEDTLVIELYNDVGPGLLHRVAIALNQDCVAYYNAEEDFGLLIGPRAADWGRFDINLFQKMGVPNAFKL